MTKNIKIKLQPLDKSNWKTCADLKVKEDQKDNLPENIISIAELNFYPKTKAVAILNNEDQVVGFATYGIPEDEIMPKIFRLMIDEKEQGRGYGKSALVEIINKIFYDFDTNEIQLAYNPEKKILKEFYGSVGFKDRELQASNIRVRVGKKMLAVLNRDDFYQKV